MVNSRTRRWKIRYEDILIIIDIRSSKKYINKVAGVTYVLTEKTLVKKI